jgi:hypothetical protein
MSGRAGKVVRKLVPNKVITRLLALSHPFKLQLEMLQKLFI